MESGHLAAMGNACVSSVLRTRLLGTLASGKQSKEAEAAVYIGFNVMSLNVWVGLRSFIPEVCYVYPCLYHHQLNNIVDEPFTEKMDYFSAAAVLNACRLVAPHL